VLQLQEIIYHGEPPRELHRDKVHADSWRKVDSRFYLLCNGWLDITDMLTDDPPKFALVDVADPD
jgi:hypothetical protein